MRAERETSSKTREHCEYCWMFNVESSPCAGWLCLPRSQHPLLTPPTSIAVPRPLCPHKTAVSQSKANAKPINFANLFRVKLITWFLMYRYVVSTICCCCCCCWWCCCFSFIYCYCVCCCCCCCCCCFAQKITQTNLADEFLMRCLFIHYANFSASVFYCILQIISYNVCIQLFRSIPIIIQRQLKYSWSK